MKKEKQIREKINFLIKLADDELNKGDKLIEHILRSKANLLKWVLEE